MEIQGKSVLVQVNTRGSSQQGKIYEYMRLFKATGMGKKGSDLTHVFYNPQNFFNKIGKKWLV